ncbi:MAG: hypothetical protein MZV64_04675 [Ignavibacteriales bacterium]|nr:hypothetical protein [Ignavibacteriales bacterium]
MPLAALVGFKHLPLIGQALAAAARSPGGNLLRPAGQHPRPDWHLVLRLQAVELCHRRLQAATARRAPSGPVRTLRRLLPAGARRPHRAGGRLPAAASSRRLPGTRRHRRGRAPGGLGAVQEARRRRPPGAVRRRGVRVAGVQVLPPRLRGVLLLHPDLRRLLGLLGHLGRAVTDAGDEGPAELQLPVPGAVGGRVLDAVAHHLVVVAARLPVPAAGVRRGAANSRGPAVGHPRRRMGLRRGRARHVHARRPVARGGVDLRGVGGRPRRLPARVARHDPAQAADGARDGPPQPASPSCGGADRSDVHARLGGMGAVPGHLLRARVDLCALPPVQAAAGGDGEPAVRCSRWSRCSCHWNGSSGTGRGWRCWTGLPIEAKAVGYALFVAVTLAFSVNAANPFIYFRF